MIVAVTPNLTRRQLAFCREYVVDMNGKAAATRAGFSAATAAQTASALLTKPEVRAAVSRLQRQAFDRIEVSAENTLKEIAALAFANLQDFVRIGDDGQPEFDLSSLDRDQWAAVQEYVEDETLGLGDGEKKLTVTRRKVKLASKVQALELLAKHFKLLTERVEHDVSEELVERLTAARQRKPQLVEKTG